MKSFWGGGSGRPTGECSAFAFVGVQGQQKGCTGWWPPRQNHWIIWVGRNCPTMDRSTYTGSGAQSPVQPDPRCLHGWSILPLGEAVKEISETFLNTANAGLVAGPYCQVWSGAGSPCAERAEGCCWGWLLPMAPWQRALCCPSLPACPQPCPTPSAAFARETLVDQKCVGVGWACPSEPWGREGSSPHRHTTWTWCPQQTSGDALEMQSIDSVGQRTLPMPFATLAVPSFFFSCFKAYF